MKDKVINLKNFILGDVVAHTEGKCWVREFGGGDHIFLKQNVEKITSIRIKQEKITSDRSHSALLVNGHVVLTSSTSAVEERFKAINLFMDT